MRGWYIMYRHRPYINVAYGTEKAALTELEDLLSPYPPDHEWRGRLHVEFVEAPALSKAGEPAYGYRLSPSRHGAENVEVKHEQKIIRHVRKLYNSGWSVKEIVRHLKGKEMKPRHGNEFTVELVGELVEGRTQHGGKEKAHAVGAAGTA